MRCTLFGLALLIVASTSTSASGSTSANKASAGASPELLRLPGDVAGNVRGVDALATDPAAVGRLDGAELQWRQQVGQHRALFRGTDLRLALPVGPVTIWGGYAWQNSQGRGVSRGSLGLSLALRPNLWLGLGAHRLQAATGDVSATTFDVGLALEASSWSTLSVGINGLEGWRAGQPLQRPRQLRLGLALRPAAGQPWLTLAAELRLAGPLLAAGEWQLQERRAVLDLAPLPGLHLVTGWRRGDDALDTWWLGLGLDSWGVHLFGAAEQSDGADAFTDRPQPLAVTLRRRPREQLWPRSGRAVVVDLEGNLEAPTSGWSPGPAISLQAWSLAAMAQDPSIDTVLLRIGSLKVGLATIDELRAAIADLRRAGKQVVAELRSGDDRAYALAAAASAVHMDPLGTLLIDGFALSVTHLTQALAQLGIRFDAVAVGRYKNFADALTLPAPRPETREVETALLSEAQALLLRALAEDRRLRPEQVEAVFARGILSAADALELGLVDALSYPTAAAMGALASRLEPAPAAAPLPAWGGGPRVAIVPLVGTIVGSFGDAILPGASVTAAQVRAGLAAAAADPRVIGVVLRVDSPGGDVEASEQIWRAVSETAARLPLVVSMGDVAASGGYYAAMGARRVLAQANTVTGSIGIVALQPDISGLLARLSIHRETFRSSPRAGWDGLTQPLEAADRARVQRRLDALYETFLNRVAGGRRLPLERVRAIAEGRVYSGRQALALGLVDRLGGLAEAVAEVAELAGLSAGVPLALEVPDRGRSLWAMAQSLTGSAQAASEPLPAGAAALASWQAAVEDVVHRLQLCRRGAFALLLPPYAVEP